MPDHEETKSELRNMLKDWCLRAEELYDHPRSRLSNVYERDEFIQFYVGGELKAYSIEKGWEQAR